MPTDAPFGDPVLISTTISATNTFAQQGWQCPVCKTVHAPYMPTCTRCSPAVVVRQGTHTVPVSDCDTTREER